MYGKYDCVCANDKRIYDKAPVNICCQEVNISLMGEIPPGAQLLEVSAFCDQACPDAIRCEQVPCRPLIKRVLGYIRLPVCVKYEYLQAAYERRGTALIPIDLLIRIPECADYEFGVIINSFCAAAGEITGSGSLIIRADICGYFCVVVETPRCLRQQEPKCAPCPPVQIYPECPPPQMLKPMPPVYPRPRPQPIPCTPPTRPMPPRPKPSPCFSHADRCRCSSDRYISPLSLPNSNAMMLPAVFADENKR
ncbi:MAG: hypothetical protein E7334_06625 [Clostridiales bacterium]|nr:hypothetical protein [Clostridiales bacterium]